MLRIGFDVDGVLTELAGYQLKYGKEYFKDFDLNEIDETQIDIEGMFKCSHEEREKFWTKYIWKYCLQIPAMRDAAFTMKTLKEQGYEIYIITSRAHTTEKGICGALFRKMLLYWLAKEGIPYDKIIYCSEENSDVDKYIACKENHIDVLVDDKAENIMSVSEITHGMCYARKHNENCFGENITRVNNFNQVYNMIQKLDGKEYFEKASREEIAMMSAHEKIVYFERVKQYYQNLPYDVEKYAREEKNYQLLSKIGSPILNKALDIRTFGKEEYLPKENGALFVANHNNYYDQFPIIASIGDHRPIHFLTATKMLDMKRGAIYTRTGTVSVNRNDKYDREAGSDEQKKHLVHKKNGFVFPEGRTNRGEAFLLDFQPGAVAMAQETDTLIYPTAVNDNYKKKDGPLCIRYGKPMAVSPLDDVMEKTNELREIIGKLKQENIDYCNAEKTKVYYKAK